MSYVPHLFHSLEHDAPFETCLTCERDFGDIADPYTVTKVYKGPECVFEYAMCLPCRRNMAASFSEESRTSMQNFFDKNPHIENRGERLAPSENHTDWMQDCATCRTPLSEITDYSIACMGFGDAMVYDPFPMMVCHNCERKIQSRLSKSTRDQWDKFILDHFDGPPAEVLKPDGVPVLL